MTLLAAENITRKFDDQVILQDVSFTIGDHERIGLVGRNGIGKTTLFEILQGRMPVDSGSITRARSCIINYVEQEKDEFLDLTLHDYIASARSDLAEMRQEIDELEHHLEQHPEDTAGLERLGELHHRFEVDGGFSFEHELEAILYGLGFVKDRFDQRLRNFSGGERNRAGLARALAGRGNLLLLDEPTNHLDIESTRWLEEYLQSLSTSYLVVSHDRAFLQAVVDTVWEMRLGKIDVYKGSFNQYLEQRAQRSELQAHRYRHQQEEIKRIEEFIRRNMAGQKTKQAQSKLKYLSRIKRVEPPRDDHRRTSIRMESSGRSWSHVLAADSLTLGYGSFPVVAGISFDIYRGDKVGMIGRNGAGKSTVLKALIGELAPAKGEIRIGNNVDVAYFDQELSDLNHQHTVLDSIWETDPLAPAEHMRSFLARYGFIGEDVFKLVGALSGGEKTKLSLARLLYHPANFIIFDEPTNHLDLDSREVLERALREFDGSFLVVSHDRFFLDAVINRLFHITDGTLHMYDGNYSYFVERTEAAASAPISTPTPEKARDEYQRFKEQSRQAGRRRKEVLSTQSRIADLERELLQLEAGIEHGIPRHHWEELQKASDRKNEIEDQLLELYAHLDRLEDESA
jgi:ATP-binding cassette subfamily F protein 3